MANRREILTTAPDLAAGGDAVARAEDGRVVFVEGAAPNERVEVEIERENRRFFRARLLRVIDRSISRADPPCPYFGTCGGCTLQHIKPEAQLLSKQRALEETLKRIGRVDPASVEVLAPWSGAAYGYRSRARFAVGKRGEIGFRALRSHAVVDVKACLLLDPPAQAALERIREKPPKADEVEAISNGKEARIEGLGSTAPLDAEDGDGPLLLSPDVFAQANREGNKAMRAHLSAHLPEVEEAIELYAGSGNFTRILARRAKRVRAYESDPRACALAERVRPKNVEVRVMDAAVALEDVLASGSASPGVLLVDPPRTGMSEEALVLSGKLAPKALFYVSCDPATFARDVSRFASHRLALDQVRLFDLYPNTAHAELIGRLRRITP